MKAVLALIIIYVGTFLVAIQGASNSPVEAQMPPRPLRPSTRSKKKRFVAAGTGGRAGRYSECRQRRYRAVPPESAGDFRQQQPCEPL